MKYKIKRYKVPVDEAIRFLNSSAKAFYSNNDDFDDSDYGVFLKVSLLTALIDLERTIRGTFNCDIFLKETNANVLKDMFPHACKMFEIKTNEDVIRLGRLLEDLRNINAHAFLCREDFNVFKNDFSFLKNEKRINENILYFDDGITMGGIIYIILNFLREKSIETLTKSNFLISLISSGKYAADDGTEFVFSISGVNLENSIRQTRGNNIFTAIFSDCIEKVEKNESDFAYKVGSPNYSTFKANGKLDGNVLVINKGSLTKAFYENDYTLEIKDERAFIELSSSLPTMVLVDYLYLKGITVFDGSISNEIKQNFWIISKLNKPKFYVNKNIRILLFTEINI